MGWEHTSRHTATLGSASVSPVHWLPCGDALGGPEESCRWGKGMDLRSGLEGGQAALAGREDC